MKENMGVLVFVFFVMVFILLLTGGKIIQYLKKAKLDAKKAADEKAQNYRDETSRQQRQYHYSGTATPKGEPKPRAEQEKETVEEPTEVHTRTATGETIIDRRSKRENKKIYEEAEGEYVEFSEE